MLNLSSIIKVVLAILKKVIKTQLPTIYSRAETNQTPITSMKPTGISSTGKGTSTDATITGRQIGAYLRMKVGLLWDGLRVPGDRYRKRVAIKLVPPEVDNQTDASSVLLSHSVLFQM